jgi:hypothetical protein
MHGTKKFIPQWKKNGYLLLPIGTKSILILLSTLGSLLLTTSLNLKQFIIEDDLQTIIFALQHLSIPQGWHISSTIYDIIDFILPSSS